MSYPIVVVDVRAVVWAASGTPPWGKEYVARRDGIAVVDGEIELGRLDVRTLQNNCQELLNGTTRSRLLKGTRKSA